MNDLNGFTLRQGHLILFHSGVGFDGYIWFTWSTEGAPSEVRVYSAPSALLPPPQVLGFFQLSSHHHSTQSPSFVPSDLFLGLPL